MHTNCLFAVSLPCWIGFVIEPVLPVCSLDNAKTPNPYPQLRNVRQFVDGHWYLFCKIIGFKKGYVEMQFSSYGLHGSNSNNLGKFLFSLRMGFFKGFINIQTRST